MTFIFLSPSNEVQLTYLSLIDRLKSFASKHSCSINLGKLLLLSDIFILLGTNAKHNFLIHIIMDSSTNCKIQRNKAKYKKNKLKNALKKLPHDGGWRDIETT